MIRPLRELPGPLRLLLGSLLLALATTLVLGQALALRIARHLDGRPGISTTDLVLDFTGGFDSLLESQVHGDMRQFLGDRREVAALAAWAREGATQEGYLSTASQVLDERCVRCHKQGGRAAFRPLDTYERARAVALAPAVPSFSRQLLVTKIHVFGIGILLALLGAATMGTALPGSTKMLIVGAGYAGMSLDFGSWWLMRLDTAFAAGRIAGNLVFTVSIGAMVVVCIVELAKLKGDR